MKWMGRRESSNIEDRRGFSGGKLAVGGGIGATLIYLLINFILGGDPVNTPSEANQLNNGLADSGVVARGDITEDEMARFAGVVLADNEDVWNRIFSDRGRKYVEPKMVLFTGITESACGSANSATGPFYCPADQKIYIDLDFFNLLQKKFGASGDFANAYVIAHEVGHHVQYLLGTSTAIQAEMAKRSEAGANQLSVGLELQADFYAGIWAHYNEQLKKVMEAGDLGEALNAANAIGDDRLQKMNQGVIVPDAFTHGTSAQRMYWFKKGFTTGDIALGRISEVFKTLGAVE